MIIELETIQLSYVIVRA